MTAKTLHEWGYRWTGPTRIQDLTPRQIQVITLAEQAEAYVQEQSREMQDSPGNGSLSRTNYNTGRSRSEWADKWSN